MATRTEIQAELERAPAELETEGVGASPRSDEVLLSSLRLAASSAAGRDLG
jgi:hypothetical protein